MKNRLNSKKSSVGFTLIETSVVILIIGIIVVISWASIQQLQPSLRLRSSARDLTTDCRYAQQKAITEQVNYGIAFSSTTNSYRVLRYGTTTQQVFEKFFSQGISFQQISGFENNEAIFNPYGAVKESGNISLINQKGEIKNIQIKPSGFVKITE